MCVGKEGVMTIRKGTIILKPAVTPEGKLLESLILQNQLICPTGPTTVKGRRVKRSSISSGYDACYWAYTGAPRGACVQGVIEYCDVGSTSLCFQYCSQIPNYSSQCNAGCNYASNYGCD